MHYHGHLKVVSSNSNKRIKFFYRIVTKKKEKKFCCKSNKKIFKTKGSLCQRGISLFLHILPKYY